MSYVIIATTMIAFVLFLRFIFDPRRALNVYIAFKPIAHPFIYLGKSFFGVPLAWMWGGIVPIVYGVNALMRKWTILCDKSVPLFILLIMSGLSLLVTIDMRASFEGIVKIMSIFFVYGIAYNTVNSFDDARSAIKAVVISSFVPLSFGFYQVIVGNYDQLLNVVVKRVNSVFGTGNTYGIFLSIAMCAVIPLVVVTKDRRSRLLYLLLLGAMFASQLLALNRATWIAFSVGALVAIGFYRKKLNMRLVLVLVVLGAVCASGVVYKRFTDVRYTWDGKQRNTFQGRIETWNSLVPVILERPIRGHGVNASEGVVFKSGHGLSPHNDYVRLAFELGLIAPIVHLFFLLSMVWFFSRRRRRDSEFWVFNFSLLILSCYMVIISATQNVVFNMTNFPMFTALCGAFVKLDSMPSASLDSKS